MRIEKFILPLNQNISSYRNRTSRKKLEKKYNKYNNYDEKNV